MSDLAPAEAGTQLCSDAANEFMPTFIDDYNRRFGKLTLPRFHVHQTHAVSGCARPSWKLLAGACDGFVSLHVPRQRPTQLTCVIAKIGAGGDSGASCSVNTWEARPLKFNMAVPKLSRHSVKCGLRFSLITRCRKTVLGYGARLPSWCRDCLSALARDSGCHMTRKRCDRGSRIKSRYWFGRTVFGGSMRWKLRARAGRDPLTFFLPAHPWSCGFWRTNPLILRRFPIA